MRIPAGAAAPLRGDGAAFSGIDYSLYALVVLLWGTSWIGIHFQLGVVDPEVSILWRFLIAALAMFGWVGASGGRLAFPLALHLRFAALGLFLFSTNFLCFYYGGLTVPSGLLAVVFSLASIGNMLLGALFFGTRPSRRLVLGAVLGFAGVATMFEPQIVGADFDRDALVGLFLCVAGTFCFCCGNMLSSAIQSRSVPVLSANAWGMGYGVLYLLAFTRLNGSTIAIEPTLLYLGSLLWLAIMASVIAFAAYLTLLGRIGAGRAGYSTVMYPVIALAISSVFEGYVWTLPAIAGLGLVLAGNLLVLTSRPAEAAAKSL
jgi:drug/metabolite transporter (DMT)-like permease